MTGRSVSRRSALAAGLGLSLSSVLAGCGLRGGAAQTAGPSAEEELILGINLELSGPGSEFGKSQQRGLKITLDQVNVDGVDIAGVRRRIRLLTQDNRGDATVAATVSEQLIAQGAVAVIGGINADTSLAMIKVAEERKVPVLSLSSADEIASPLVGRKFTYKLAPNAADVAQVIAHEVRAQKLRHVSVVAASDAAGNAGVRALGVALKAIRERHDADNVLDVVRLPRSGKDLAGAAARAVDRRPDGIIVWATAPTSGEVVKELRDTGYTGKVFLDPGAVADSTLAGSAGEALEDAFVCYPAVLGGAPFLANTPSGRAARTFINRYIQEYGSFSGFAPYASDAVLLVAAAARRANSTDPRRLRGSLEAVPYEGVAGAYAFSPIDHGGMAPDVLTMFSVKQRSWIRLS